VGEFAGTERFAIERRLGTGGMGVVYQALDRDRNVRVALKTLHRLEPETLYRLKNEFRSLQDLAHPNLVGLGELHEVAGQWFFTMELIDGVDFCAYVRPGWPDALDELVGSDNAIDAAAPTITPGDAWSERGAAVAVVEPSMAAAAPVFDESRLRNALAQLAAGVLALHAAGRIHRDIKPSNIRVTPQGRVVLLDFGLITEVGGGLSPSTEAHAVGTAAYMAPEQAASRPVGPAADWYSVGVVLYQALTGRLPFVGSPLDMFVAKQERAPRPPRQLAPTVPEDLEALCLDLLRADPAGRPVGRTAALRMGVGATRSAGSASRQSGAGLFVGREAEQVVLEEAFAATRRGQAATVYVHGESGVGKSALIRFFLHKVATQVSGAVLLTGRCYERESVPYKAVDAVVDALSRYMRRLPLTDAAMLLPRYAALLPRVFPVLGRVKAIADSPPPSERARDPHELRARAFGALRDLLSLLAERWPLVVAIDDLQWADADSLHLLRDLMRPPDPPALLLCISSRLSPLAREAPRLPGTVQDIDLGPLAAEAAHKLARALLARAGIRDGVSPSLIAVEARGHPLFIDEIVRHAALAAARPGPGAPARLRLDEAIWARVLALAEPARRLLGLVVSAGAPTPQEIVRDALAMDPTELGRQVAVLRVANLIRGHGEALAATLEPYHDRVREAVMAHLGDAERARYHAALAGAFESSRLATEHPEILLRHLEAAGETGKAARYAERAARRAAESLAFDQAAEAYLCALRLGNHDEAHARGLQRERGEALVAAGRGPEAAEAFLAAAAGADPDTRLSCRIAAAEQLLVSGHTERGLDAVREVLAEVGVALPRTSRAALISLLWNRAKLRLRGLGWTARDANQVAASDLKRIDVHRAAANGLAMVDPVRGADFQVRGLLLALGAGEPGRIGQFLAREAGFLAAQGGRGLARGRDRLEDAKRLAVATGDPYLGAWTTALDAVVSFFECRLAASCELAVVAERRLREVPVGTLFEQNLLLQFRFYALTLMGGFAELTRLYDERLRDATRRGDHALEKALRRDNRMVGLARDQPEDVHADIAWVAARTAPDDSLGRWYEVQAKGEVYFYEGRGAEAAPLLAPGLAAFARSTLTRIQGARVAAWWLRGRLAVCRAHLPELTTRRHALLTEAARMVRRLAAERVGYAEVEGILIDAALAVHRADPRRALDRLLDAISAAERHDMPVYAAAARRRQGQLLGGDEGTALIARADDWMGRAGIRNPARMADVYAAGWWG
jgi:hypothetical protein